MDCPKSLPLSASDSPILRSLARAKPASDQGLLKALSAIKTKKRDVTIPGYDSFALQGWGDLFSGGGPLQPTTREQDRHKPGEQRHEKPRLSLEKLEALLSPPDLFFQGHLSKELPSILSAIGCTPLVRLSRISDAAGCACQLLGKCEFLNAGGSTKDRIALGMVQTAEATGQLADGAALIEPTSGNTGIGLALVGAVKGYRSVAVMPMKMSAEKHRIMQALGATILRTPTEAAWNDQTSHIALSIRLTQQLQQQQEAESRDNSQGTKSATPPPPATERGKRDVARILDQYRNPANPLTHFFGTAAELLQQSEQMLDMVVVCAGTGGTLTGIGKRIKRSLPNCLVVGVDPVGSVLADPTQPPGKPYYVEGIGYDFVPTVLDREVADFWVKVTDGESLLCARLLVKLEGMLVGGSAGAALAGTFKAIERVGWEEDKTKRIAMILPDGSRNYTSKIFCDEWMVDKGFLEPECLVRQYREFSGLQVASLRFPQLQYVAADTPLREAASLLVEAPQQVLCVVEPLAADMANIKGGAPRSAVVGTVCQISLLRAFGEMPNSTEVKAIAETDTPVYSLDTQLSRVAQSLELRPFVLIEAEGLVKAAVGHGLMLGVFASKQQ